MEGTLLRSEGSNLFKSCKNPSALINLTKEGIERVQGPVKKMADYSEDNQSFSMDEEIEGVQGGGQNMLGGCEVNSSFSIDEERIEGVQEGGQDITGHEIANPSFSVDKEIMDQNCDTTTIEDFANPL